MTPGTVNGTNRSVTVSWDGLDVKLSVLTAGLKDFDLQKQLDLVTPVALAITFPASSELLPARAPVSRYARLPMNVTASFLALLPAEVMVTGPSPRWRGLGAATATGCTAARPERSSGQGG